MNPIHREALLTNRKSARSRNDEDIGLSTAEALHGAVALREFETVVATSGTLPTVDGYEQLVSPDSCVFAAEAIYDKRGDNDPSGTLLLTPNHVLFYADSGRTAIPWAKVVVIARDGRTLSRRRRDRQTATLFDLPTFGGAMRAEFVAKHLLSDTTSPAPERRAKPTNPEAPKDKTVEESKTSADAPVGTYVELPGAGGFGVPLVGESYRQGALKTFDGGRRNRGEEVVFTAVVVPDPANPYDPNAIKVFIHNGAHVGYLSREDAVRYGAVAHALRQQSAAGLCRARLIGGTDGKLSIGVVLDLAEPSVLLRALARDSQPF